MSTFVASQGTDAAQPLIRLEGVSKIFHTDELETHAVADIDLGVARGAFVAIVGPSGSGKSTLLSILGLLDAPSTGSYWLGGRAVHGLGRAARARIRKLEIGFVFQSFNLIGDLSVFENVELPLTYQGVASRARRERVEAALARVEMGHRVRHVPGQLSGGEQQRVAIARALVGRPSLLLADEPTGNLDSRNGGRILDLLGELNQAGSTICMVTHDVALAQAAQRTVHLLDGRLEEPTAGLRGGAEMAGVGLLAHVAGSQRA